MIDFLRIQSRAFLFTAAAVPAAVGAALAALRIIRSPDGPPLFARVLENARYLNRGLHELGFHVVEPQPLPDGSTVVTPIVPVLVGDDWKAVLLWRALYDAGVYVNVALHPGRAARRRAAAHERDGHPRPGDARPRARALRARQGGLRGRARRASWRVRPIARFPARRTALIAIAIPHKAEQIPRCLRMIAHADVDLSRPRG